jgi:hypothetical protein
MGSFEATVPGGRSGRLSVAYDKAGEMDEIMKQSKKAAKPL